MEEWRHIKGYEGMYLISSLGRVKSLPRVKVRSNGRPHTIKERILKPALDSSGYLRVALSKDRKLTTLKIHRIVAEHFYTIEVNKEVNHIDGDKTNNSVENLEWVTRSENVKHAFDIGLANSMRGSNNPTSKIDELTALTVKTFIESKYKLKYISDKLGISYNIVKDISRKRTWSWL